MPTKSIASIFFIIVIGFNSYSTPSHAENAQLTLSMQDLTWLSCEPNENIDQVIRTLKNNYKIKMSSMEYAGHNSYVTGDPTPAMAWFLSIEKNPRGKLIGMQYSRWKDRKGGVRITTNRGIKYGSGIASVFDSYGAHPKIVRTRHPRMNYVKLHYPFVLEKTGQKGELKFTLRHKLGSSDETATVITIEWILV